MKHLLAQLLMIAVMAVSPVPSRAAEPAAASAVPAPLASSAPVATVLPPPPRDEANAAFWWRMDHPAANPLEAPYSSYWPLVPLKGEPGPFLPSAPQGHTTVPASALEEASSYVEGSRGMALIVVHRGVVQLERYFNGFDAEQTFSAHSMAKTLGAMAIGVALQEGRIRSLDQPASTWLKEWRDASRAAITLRQLLTMSGGFRNEPNKVPGSHYIQLHYGADVEAIVREAPLAYPPGTDFAWDNDNSHAISLVVERATGQSYLDFVSTRLWKPLGASDAEQMLDRPGGRAMAYCCIWSRARDWVRIGQMLLDGGRWQGKQLLDERFVREMRAPAPTNPAFGYQVYLGAAWKDPRLNRRAIALGDDKVEAVAPDQFYLSGVGGLQLMIVPSEQLLVLRVGKSSPAWREPTLSNLLVGALRAVRAGPTEAR
ncbi:serine hydrolase [Roseateles sp. SL47]|uniref:serine hydrolase domain-containing protein n=1 Tax=Roseateles sp. SL47 TaxID=2995138 RepID=UPI00226E6E47|nr:serine hydrolase [Roseateles sp. SL47]WAC71975.1 serine hydrolase [Roseateles sp. SL47]